MTFTLGHSNIQQTDPESHQFHTVDEVRDHCDLATWNEAIDMDDALRAMSGWEARALGGLAISWKVKQFDLIGADWARVMKGGNLGTGKPGDHRRRGPNRYVLWAVLVEKATGRKVIVATHHSIAKADTDNKWRRSLRAAAWKNVVTALRGVKKRHPGASLILTGDMNTIGKITAFASLGVREVKTPKTFARRLRYDRLFATLRVLISNVRTLTTKSDHKALLATVTLGPAVEPPPVPPKPKPDPKPEPKPEVHAMKFVSRAQWGARRRGATTSSHPIGKTLGITFHWEGPHMGAFQHSACKFKVRGIEAFHRDKRGWADIAYNAIVCPHGYVFEGRGAGVRSAANGNTSTNDDWYAVCYLGGQGDPFTAAAKEGFEDAVAWLRAKGNAGHRINGHRDHKSTECPGATIYKWAHSHDFDGSSTPTPSKPQPDPPNNVQEGRADIKAGLDRIDRGVAKLRTAHTKKGQPRKVVRDRAEDLATANAASRAIYRKGPSS